MTLVQIKFKRRVRRAGGSYVVAIPREICQAVRLKPDEEVEIFIEGDKIVIRKI
jgi:antitoxin component of MazEF toxin-antitoxin module